nr:hypothetical protein [uncultured Cohaesibacter sp.]
MSPRLISTKDAARYCGVSTEYLRSNYPGRHIQIGRYLKWDRKVLDRWIDEMSGLSNSHEAEENTVENYGWDE